MLSPAVPIGTQLLCLAELNLPCLAARDLLCLFAITLLCLSALTLLWLSALNKTCNRKTRVGLILIRNWDAVSRGFFVVIYDILRLIYWQRNAFTKQFVQHNYPTGKS